MLGYLPVCLSCAFFGNKERVFEILRLVKKVDTGYSALIS